MSKHVKLTKTLGRKILKTVDAGLTSGVGKPEPGKMCVEAAICYALGLPHGDDPECVAPSVRAFKITLNDARWSSKQARAQGMRALAIAQLNSKDTIDEQAFAKRLAELTIRRLLPPLLESIGLNKEADRCADEGTREAAAAAADDADARYAAAADADAADAAAAAAAAAADAADDAAADAADAARYATAAAAAAAAAAGDRYLILSANIALDVLRELNAPGVALWDRLQKAASK